MAGPSQSVRLPAVAGLFYPADPARCRDEAAALLGHDEPASGATRWQGGIVPHAAWMCSGTVAGRTISALAGSRRPDLVVVFGAIHTPLRAPCGLLDPHLRWQVPSGESELPAELEQKLCEKEGLFETDERFHREEHAIEVELPLIQAAWPEAAMLPVEVPISSQAIEIGRETARQAQRQGLEAIFLASSDLTHYGPAYEFMPAGIGSEALEWAKTNDRRLLDLVCRLDVEAVVPEVMQNRNACGGGAITAMLAACREFGARSAQVLRHANSYETLSAVRPQLATDAVGYASVVVG